MEAVWASSTVSPGSPDHSSQPALAATLQAPPSTLQAPTPKPVRDICKEDQSPKQAKVPVRSKPAKPAAKRAANNVETSSAAPSSNPQPIPEMPAACVTGMHMEIPLPVERALTKITLRHVSVAWVVPVLCMQCCSHQVVRLYGATPPSQYGGPSLHDPPPSRRGTGLTLGGGVRGAGGTNPPPLPMPPHANAPPTWNEESWPPLSRALLLGTKNLGPPMGLLLKNPIVWLILWLQSVASWTYRIILVMKGKCVMDGTACGLCLDNIAHCMLPM